MAIAVQEKNYKVTLQALDSSPRYGKNKSIWNAPIKTIDSKSLPELIVLTKAWVNANIASSNEWEMPLVFLNGRPIGFMGYTGVIASIDGVEYAED